MVSRPHGSRSSDSSWSFIGWGVTGNAIHPAGTRAPVDSQGGYTHLHFTVRPNSRDLCNSQLWNAVRSPKDAEQRNVGLLGGLLFDRVLDPLVQWQYLPLNASLRAYGGTQAPKEPYLASGRFVVDGSFRMVCFPRGRNSKSLSNTGVRMCVSRNTCIYSRGSCLSLFGDPANLW